VTRFEGYEKGWREEKNFFRRLHNNLIFLFPEIPYNIDFCLCHRHKDDHQHL